MFCYNCGKKIEDGVSFCAMCGAPQRANSQKQPVQNVAIQNMPAQNASVQNIPSVQHQQTDGVKRLYMDAKGLTLLNYKFDIRDEMGNLCYRAATVTESMLTYNARVYYPNDAEAMIIRQQKKMTMAAMNFDIFAPDGNLITEVLQKIHFTTSEFQLPQQGIVVTGDFLSINFSFMRGNQKVATVSKKILSWGDCYEIEFYDSSLDKLLLATIMVIQMVIAASRKRRRR